jgi:hypothetical protein
MFWRPVADRTIFEYPHFRNAILALIQRVLKKQRVYSHDHQTASLKTRIHNRRGRRPNATRPRRFVFNVPEWKFPSPHTPDSKRREDDDEGHGEGDNGSSEKQKSLPGGQAAPSNDWTTAGGKKRQDAPPGSIHLLRVFLAYTLTALKTGVRENQTTPLKKHCSEGGLATRPSPRGSTGSPGAAGDTGAGAGATALAGRFSCFFFLLRGGRSPGRCLLGNTTRCIRWVHQLVTLTCLAA